MSGSDDFHGTDLSVAVGKAYVVVILFIIPLILILSIFYIWIGEAGNFFSGLAQLTTLPSILPVLIIGIPLHELLHAVGWSIFGRISLKQVKFGMLWKALTPYAHLKNPIGIGAYRAGTMAPFLVMGIVPYVIGVVIGNAWLANFGLLFILAAGGDLLVIWTLRGVHREAMVIDHPTRVGCIVVGEKCK